MLVGNDIVDLHDPESRPEALHAGFDARVFTSGEREALSASPCPHSLRWTLWAAKESAYKLAKKLDPKVRFLWRKFSVSRIGESRRGAGRMLVDFLDGPVGPFDVRVDLTDDYVHAVATLAGPNGSDHHCARAGIERLKTTESDPSRTVRDAARIAIASRAELPPEQVRIGARRGVPVALWRNRSLPVDLSLSHMVRKTVGPNFPADVLNRFPIGTQELTAGHAQT